MNDPRTVEVLDQAKQPKKCILGTPWYTVLSDDAYREAFGYIGADVSEREKLIEDGEPEKLDENDNMLESQVRTRCEQSDLVLILLNLAVIPDSVIRALPNFKRGW